jgi:hypothetical protein
MTQDTAQPHIRVEYDLEFAGGNYDKVGRFYYVPVAAANAAGSVEEAFKRLSGYDPMHIIHYSPDEWYDQDGEPWPDDSID